MLFNSLQYLIFLPIVVGLYYVVPHKWRWLLLLVASYYFYMCWKAVYAILLLISTGAAYGAGLGIDRTENIRTKKIYLWSCITLLLGVLFSFKYFNFASASLRDSWAIVMQIIKGSEGRTEKELWYDKSDMGRREEQRRSSSKS